MARPKLLDGRGALRDVLRRAGYPSVLHALAEHTVFLHPDTVKQTNGDPVFRVIRGPGAAARGRIVQVEDGHSAMLDDNSAPTDAFLWSADHAKGTDLQFNHIWSGAKDVRYYTALWNICATPAFLAKLTDADPAAKMLLRRRSYELYGYLPDGESVPETTEGHQPLLWHDYPPPAADLEGVLRGRLHNRPRSRTTRSARECGWVFSGFEPDRSV